MYYSIFFFTPPSALKDIPIFRAVKVAWQMHYFPGLKYVFNFLRLAVIHTSNTSRHVSAMRSCWNDTYCYTHKMNTLNYSRFQVVLVTTPLGRPACHTLQCLNRAKALLKSNKGSLNMCVKCLIKTQRPRKCEKQSLSVRDSSCKIHAISVGLWRFSLNYWIISQRTRP